MEMYTYQGLKEKATNEQRKLCAWTPKNPELSNAEEDKWKLDPSGNPANYDLDQGPHSTKIVILPEKPAVNPETQNKGITRDVAETLSYRDILHFGECKRTVGPRGGVKEKIVQVRINGKCQTWKTRPNEFKTPFAYGLYDHGYITHVNGHEFHRAKDCPLNKPESHIHDETCRHLGFGVWNCGVTDQH